MKIYQNEDVLESFETSAESDSFIPELFVNMGAQESSPELIVDWLSIFKLPAYSTRVLNLSCGKGSVSVALAKKYKFQVFGFDCFKPFIIEATNKAKEMKIENLCRFEFADIKNIICKAKNFDIVIYSVTSKILGRLDQTVESLRKVVRPGGLIIIDTGFHLSNNNKNISGNNYYFYFDDALNQLKSQGDLIVFEQIFPYAEIRKASQKNAEFLKNRISMYSTDLSSSFNWYQN